MSTWQTPKEDWSAVNGVSAADLNRIEGNINVNKAATDTYTAADVLTKIKTVDGSGSGLDADLLDGMQPSTANTANTIVQRDGSGAIVGGTFSSLVNGDAIFQMESTAAPTTSYRLKRIYSSNNVGAGSDWLFRQTRPSDGAIEDFFLRTGQGGDIWTTARLRNNSGVLEFFDASTWKAVGGVKNVQRNTTSIPDDGTTTTVNVTITSVNTAKSFVTYSVRAANSGTSAVAYDLVTVRLTSATNLEIQRALSTSSTVGLVIAWEVVESY